LAGPYPAGFTAADVPWVNGSATPWSTRTRHAAWALSGAAQARLHPEVTNFGWVLTTAPVVGVTCGTATAADGVSETVGDTDAPADTAVAARPATVMAATAASRRPDREHKDGLLSPLFEHSCGLLITARKPIRNDLITCGIFPFPQVISGGRPGELDKIGL
jgi:hypothetical protein